MEKRLLGLFLSYFSVCIFSNFCNELLFLRTACQQKQFTLFPF